MKASRFLQIMLLVSNLTLFIGAHSDVICQNFKFAINEDVVYNHILEGHVFKRLTVHSAAQCHMGCKDDCLCTSMNYFPVFQENNCELNAVDKAMKPSALKWKQGVNYYDLVRSYIVKGGGKYIPEKHFCANRCCRDKPCVNGGVCAEICDPYSTRFNCTCPDTHTGLRCETIKHPRTCKDFTKDGSFTLGKYLIFSSVNQTFPVFCDVESESGIVWTLIQSFSLANNGFVRKRPFDVDFPLNYEDSDVNWHLYRLSLTQMWYIANQSTHFRATCNFPTEGLQYTDYARAKLESFDIFGIWDFTCRMYEYINIRGIECSNCTAATRQLEGKAWRIESYRSRLYNCQFDGSPGAEGNENNFGWFRFVNTNHSCSSSPNSTTQHWFGVKMDL